MEARVVAKQSSAARGVWFNRGRRWVSASYVNGKQHAVYFPVSRYFTPGMSFEEASQLAYEAAVAHRRGLEASGAIRIGAGRPAIVGRANKRVTRIMPKKQ